MSSNHSSNSTAPKPSSSHSSQSRSNPHSSSKSNHSSHSSSSNRKRKEVKFASEKNDKKVPSSESEINKKKKKSGLLSSILPYRISLPLPPFESKFINLNFPHDRLTSYCHSLDLIPSDIIFDPFAVVPLEIIDTDVYNRPNDDPTVKKNVLDPLDAELFIDETKKKVRLPSQQQKIEHQTFTWLRKGEYMSNNLFEKPASIKDDNDSQNNKIIEEELANVNKSREEQIEIIENSFKLAKSIPSHPRHKNWSFVESFEIFPVDFLCEKFDENGNEKVEGINGSASSNAKEKIEGDGEYSWISFVSNPFNINSSNSNQTNETPHQSNTSQYLLKTYEENHQVLYQQNNNNNNNDNSNNMDESEYNWVREFIKLPVPPVEDSNNFLFLFDRNSEDSSLNKIFYYRYSDRLRLAPRIADRHNDKSEAAQAITSRPHSILFNNQIITETNNEGVTDNTDNNDNNNYNNEGQQPDEQINATEDVNGSTSENQNEEQVQEQQEGEAEQLQAEPESQEGQAEADA